MSRIDPVHFLFGVPVYAAKSERVAEIRSEIDDCVENLSVESWKAPVSTNTTALGDDIISRYSLRVFEEEMHKHLDVYCRGIGFDPRQYLHRISWLTRNEKNDYTHVHNHTSTDISGVYYHRTTGSDGNFFFMNPNLAATTAFCFGAIPAYTEVQPQEGLFILFPSYMLHGVKTNHTDNTRISLAFNFLYNRVQNF